MYDLLNYDDEQANLTNDLKKCIDYIDNFLENNNSNICIINGKNNTGKTTLVKYLLNKIKNSMLLVPTNRTKKILLYNYNLNAKTIHSEIYNWNGGVYEDSYTYYIPSKKNESSNCIYIFYNSFIISDFYNAGILKKYKYGSEKLLSDILHYIFGDNLENKSENKIIFIGNNTLLNPVYENLCPALDKKYIEETYKLSVCEYELKELIGEDSKSLLSSFLSDCINKSDFNNIDIKADDKDIFVLDDDSFLDEFINLRLSDKFAQEIIITSSHYEAYEYNLKIREKLGRKTNNLERMDKLILLDSIEIGNITLYNGEFVYIESISEDESIIIEQKVNDKKYKIVLRKANIFYFPDKVPVIYNVYIYENCIYSDEEYISKPVIDLIKEYERKNNLRITENLIAVKYGYAITCHKAKDGKWKNVFVDCNTYHPNKMTKDYFKWINTAITVSSNKIFFKNTPNIKLGINLNADVKEIDYENIGKILLDIIKNNTNLDERYDISISDRDKYNYVVNFCNKDNISRKIRLYYNKKFLISHILPLDDNDESKLIIENLRCLINKKISDKQEEIPKLNNDVLDDIIRRNVLSLRDNGFQVEVKLMPYRIRFELVYDGEEISVDFNYKKDNVISKIQYNPEFNQELIKRINNIIG